MNWKRSKLNGEIFPAWTNAVAVVLIFSSIIFIPAMALHHIHKKGSVKVSHINVLYFRKQTMFRTPVSLHLTGVHIYPRTEKIHDMKTVVTLTVNPTFKSGRVVGLICWTHLLPFPYCLDNEGSLLRGS